MTVYKNSEAVLSANEAGVTAVDLHAKTYLSDDKYAIIGTINIDYRSLVHHFENGVWLYNCASIVDIKKDIDCTLNQSVEITDSMLKNESAYETEYVIWSNTELPGVDTGILDPRDTYAAPEEWEAKAKDLAARFIKNFDKYTTNEAGKALVAAGPKL